MRQVHRTLALLAVATVMGTGLYPGPVEAQPKVSSIEIEGELRKVAKSLILTTMGLNPGVELSQ